MGVIAMANPAQIAALGGQKVKEGLECHVGRAALAVPVGAVDQIVEVDVASPVPLAKPWVAGIGMHAGRFVVSLSVAGILPESIPRRRHVKGILLRGSDSTSTAYLLEVSGVASLIHIAAVERPRAIPNRTLPSWLLEGRTSDGRTLGFIDVEALFGEFLE